MTVIVDMETSPGAIPGHYLLFTASSRPSECRRQDNIARGVMTVVDAERYPTAYQSLLDHFLYSILANNHSATNSIASLRKVSTGLTTAICTVGAPYLASPDYDILYKEFVAFSAGLSFAKRSTLDDVRALCIGAFWLGDLSSSLVGIAVRIATESQLHRSFQKALDGDNDHYLRTRLYYLVYVCDHHFSIPYGRPPIARECEVVQNARSSSNASAPPKTTRDWLARCSVGVFAPTYTTLLYPTLIGPFLTLKFHRCDDSISLWTLFGQSGLIASLQMLTFVITRAREPVYNIISRNSTLARMLGWNFRRHAIRLGFGLRKQKQQDLRKLLACSSPFRC